MFRPRRPAAANSSSMAGAKCEPNTSALVVPDGHQAVDELRGHRARVGPVGQLALLGQRAPLEPVEQRQAEAADRPDLREVDVGVDEAGEQQPAVQAGDRLAGVRGAQRGQRAAGRDHAVPDQQRAVLGQRAPPGPR